MNRYKKAKDDYEKTLLGQVPGRHKTQRVCARSRAGIGGENMNEKKTGTNVPQQPTQPPMPPRGGSAAHRPAQTVKIGVETEGLDESTAKIETLADALDGFPPQVVIKGAKNCAFNIYPSQVLKKTTQVTKDPEDQDGEAQDID